MEKIGLHKKSSKRLVFAIDFNQSLDLLEKELRKQINEYRKINKVKNERPDPESMAFRYKVAILKRLGKSQKEIVLQLFPTTTIKEFESRRKSVQWALKKSQIFKPTF